MYENFIVILPVLVGLNLFFQNIKSNELTVYLYNTIELNNGYESKFEVYNEGSPISKYELIQPLTLNIGSENKINDFDLISKSPDVIKVWFSKLTSNKLKIDFDLLNEDENITFSILTKKPIEQFTVSSRIKNINEVTTYHFQVKPKYYDRIGVFWVFLFIFSIVTFLDAYLLVSKNKQLNSLLIVIENLDVNSNKKIFEEDFREKYSNFKVRFKRNKESLIIDLCSMFDSITEKNINEVKLKMKSITKRSVLYTLRKPYLLISPILFIISLLVIVGSILFYSGF